MRALDPRLLRRTKAARPLLAIDSALGVGNALAVLAQATCWRGSSRGHSTAPR